MVDTLPKNQAILKYEDFFNKAPPKNALDLIHNYCKATVLGEFAGLNYRLKPKNTMYYDTSLDTQINLLFYFCGSNEDLFNKYRKLYSRFIYNKNNYSSIFTRQTCLYASEQLVNSRLKEIEGFTMRYSWEGLLRYLLAVNSEITRQSDQPNDIENKEKEVFNFETLNPKLIPLNELSIEVNPLYTPFRGHKLMEYLSNHLEFGSHFKTYFIKTYGITFDHFIYELLSMYYANNRDGLNDITNEFTGEKLDTSFYYTVKNEDVALFDELSQVFENTKTERLISIKKYPFYKSLTGQFLLLDNILLLDKSYNQFINDFWFDTIKLVKEDATHLKFGVDYYRSVIGYFVENYSKEIFDYSFKTDKHHVLKTFNELKVQNGSGEIELADIYIRYTKKIFIAQVKSTGLYDDQKYSGDVNEMYRKDRDQFFDSFGIDQIITTIRNLKDVITQVDPAFPLDKNCHIFPAIVVNEKAMQTPLMAQIFNDRFNEKIVALKLDKLKINPLCIIHISDLEQMEDYLHDSPPEFWRILKYHLRSPEFIPPFYNSINRLNIKSDFKKTRILFEKLVLKYQKITDISTKV